MALVGHGDCISSAWFGAVVEGDGDVIGHTLGFFGKASATSFVYCRCSWKF